jgi:hypothetical protein
MPGFAAVLVGVHGLPYETLPVRDQSLTEELDPLPLQILNENKALWNVRPVEDKRGIASLCGPGCKGA